MQMDTHAFLYAQGKAESLPHAKSKASSGDADLDIYFPNSATAPRFIFVCIPILVEICGRKRGLPRLMGESGCWWCEALVNLESAEACRGVFAANSMYMRPTPTYI